MNLSVYVSTCIKVLSIRCISSYNNEMPIVVSSLCRACKFPLAMMHVNSLHNLYLSCILNCLHDL